MEWAAEFYKKQFLLTKRNLDEISKSTYLQEVLRIQEQIGKSFFKVLELGAGNGQFAKENTSALVNILCGDFYKLPIQELFDCILYIDGFGVGEDEDQLQLLKRIYKWLHNDGYALIDIYEPNYWRQVYKSEITLNDEATIFRKYDFNEETMRFTDTWWHKNYEDDKSTQSLKCYSISRIYELCQSANLDIVGYFPNGAMDFKTWTYYETASLDYCISYRIKVKKK